MIKKNGGIFGRNPTYNDVVVEGTLTMKEAQVFENDITINGDLTVNGTTTTINTVELNVDDKNITMGAVTAKVGLAATTNITAGQFTVELVDTSGLIPGMTVTKTSGTGAFGAGAKIASINSHTQITLDVAHATSGSIIFDTGGATDDTADGGGITLKGTTDKFIKWVKASLAWVFSDPIKAPDITVDNLTASKPVFTDANKKLTSTGTLAINQGGTGATDAATARTNLGLGSAATSSTTDFAPSTKGVTNGDSHDHNGGDGAQIAYSSLSGLPTLGTMASQAANNVAITGGAVDGVTIGATTPATVANVDNIKIDGNTISTTDTNGNMLLRPNGTGKILGRKAAATGAQEVQWTAVSGMQLSTSDTHYYGHNWSGGESANPDYLIGDWHNASGRFGWNSAGRYTYIDSHYGSGVAPILFTGNDLGTVFGRWDGSGHFYPGADNTQSCGASGYRWSVVYAGTGTINTSDARTKTDVRSLTENEINAAIQLSQEIGAYQFLDAIADKGDAARLHIGMTVQRAMQIMEANNLDPMRYGFICYDKWDDEYLTIPAREAEPAKLDEEGNEILPAKQAREESVVLVRKAGDMYSFRPDELTLFILRGITARLAIPQSQQQLEDVVANVVKKILTGA